MIARVAVVGLDDFGNQRVTTQVFYMVPVEAAHSDGELAVRVDVVDYMWEEVSHEA